MPTILERQLSAAQAVAVTTRRQIAWAARNMNDPWDRRLFITSQQQALQRARYEIEQLRAQLGDPIRPPVKLNPTVKVKAKPRSSRTVVLSFPEFRDAVLEGTLKQRVKHGDFTVQATRRQMSGLGEMVKRLKSLP